MKRSPKYALRRSLKDRFSWDVVELDARGKVKRRLVTEAPLTSAQNVLFLAEEGMLDEARDAGHASGRRSSRR